MSTGQNGGQLKEVLAYVAAAGASVCLFICDRSLGWGLAGWSACMILLVYLLGRNLNQAVWPLALLAVLAVIGSFLIPDQEKLLLIGGFLMAFTVPWIKDS